MSLLAPPEEPGLVKLYAADVVRIKPWPLEESNIHPFNQGPQGGYMIPKLPANTWFPVES